MEIRLKNRTIKSIADTAWVNDLSEEEDKVLKRAHFLDERMRMMKPEQHAPNKFIAELKKTTHEK